MTLAEFKAAKIERWNVVEGRWEGGKYFLTEAVAETYYRTAYEHGAEAFARGEDKDDCPYTYSVVYSELGVSGWTNGWIDARNAQADENWWDDASYAAYQARD